MGTIKTSNCNFIGAKQTFQKALDLTTEPFWGSSITIKVHYFAVGYLTKAHEKVKESIRRDPLLQITRNEYILSLASIGDVQQAERECNKFRILVGQNHWDDMANTHVRLCTKDIISHADIVYSNPINIVGKNFLASPKEGLAALHKLYTQNNITSWELKVLNNKVYTPILIQDRQ